MSISVIIPVYNLESIIKDCIESINSQNFEKYEAIFINDGSTDSSGSILDNYAENNINIKVIHSPNRGVTAARKLGVENATGEYIFFVDGDDQIPNDALSTLHNFAKTNQLDIAIGSYFTVYPNKRILRKSVINGVFDGDDYLNYLLSGYFHTGPWARLIRRELFDNETLLLPRHFTFGEDTVMNIRLALKANKIGYITHPVYFYIMRLNSSVHTFKVTLNHEMELEQYIVDAIKKANKESISQESIVHFKIKIIQDMLISNCFFEINNPWIVDVIKKTKTSTLSTKEQITLLIIRNNLFIYLFRLLHKVKALFIKSI